MKTGIVGCGLNADYHVNFSRSYPNLELVGLVDKDPVKARECAERHGIGRVFSSIQELVAFQKPDVIHIVTPPRSHFALAAEAIRAGCHVLVEKPLALSFEEAVELYDLASEHCVNLVTMHNHFFDPCMIKARSLIENGSAGEIIHVESHYGLNTQIDAFRKYPAPNELPWLYGLPGGVFHDFMPHPLYVMLPFTGKPREIKVMESSHGVLPQGLSDELRILLQGEHCPGSVVFSFAARPHLHFVRFYGSRMMIHVDFNTMTTTCHALSTLPKAAQKATYNLGESWQLLASTVKNVWDFGRGKLKPYQGMRTLIHRTYDSIGGNSELPVTREEALMVIGTMDEVWKQLRGARLRFDPIMPPVGQAAGGSGPRVLVTGATGFLGRRLCELLTVRGYVVRALVRKLSRIEPLKTIGAEIFFGDVASRESLVPAFEGVDYVIHAAADTAGSERDGELSTVQGTANVLGLCEEHGIQKLVYISSLSVYGVSDYRRGQTVTEESSLERFPVKRGPYSHAKLEAEKAVSRAMVNGTVPIVCLRPGTIYGPGGEVFTPMMGFAMGSKLFAMIGNGSFVLPVVYIDNLVEAILAAMSAESSTGKTYNVVDPEAMTKRQYVDQLLKRLYSKAHFSYIPYSLLYSAVLGQEILCKFLRRKPFLTRYRLTSSQRSVVYDSTKLMRETGWKPVVSGREGIERLLAHELQQS